MQWKSSCSYTFPEAGCLNEIKIAGKEMQMNWPECSVQVRKVVFKGCRHFRLGCCLWHHNRVCIGASRQSQKGLPSLGSGHVGQESVMWLPSGWQGGPNLPP